MDDFEKKLTSFEPREPSPEQRAQILANAPCERSDARAGSKPQKKKQPEPRGRLVAIATSRWFLFAALPLSLFGTAGICAVSM